MRSRGIPPVCCIGQELRRGRKEAFQGPSTEMVSHELDVLPRLGIKEDFNDMTSQLDRLSALLVISLP